MEKNSVYIYIYINQCSVQSLSRVGLLAIPWTAACQASLSITNSWSLLKRMYIESVMPSNHLILCRPLLLPPSIFPSMRVFSNESILCIRWPKHWSFSFNISPSNEYSGLISFRMDWWDLLAVQGTLKSLHQHPEFTQTHVHRDSDAIQHLILCRPLPILPSIFPSIRGFSNESALSIRWPKYWSFSFNISPSSEYSGLISLRWTGWNSLQSKELARVFSNTTV